MNFKKKNTFLFKKFICVFINERLHIKNVQI